MNFRQPGPVLCATRRTVCVRASSAPDPRRVEPGSLDIDAADAGRERRWNGVPRGLRRLVVLLLAVLLVLGVCWVGAAWYFAGEIGDGALDVSEAPTPP